MVDQCPFLLETLTRVDHNTFFFQQHFKVTCDFLSPQFMHVFLCLNNSSSNKWFDFKIPSRNVCTIITFLACFLTRYLNPIMPKFYHLLAQRWVFGLQFNQYFKVFYKIPWFFFIMFWIWLGLPHPSIVNIPLTLWVSTSFVVLMVTNT